MIKIEKISAEDATIVRGGLRQPLVLHSHINPAELITIEAVNGTIVYSVDEQEVLTLEFPAKQVTPPAAPAKPEIKQPAKVAKPVVDTPSQDPQAS